jgi:hypothetical protein
MMNIKTENVSRKFDENNNLISSVKEINSNYDEILGKYNYLKSMLKSEIHRNQVLLDDNTRLRKLESTKNK